MGAKLAKSMFFIQPKHSTYNKDSDYWIDKLIYINKNHQNRDSNHNDNIPCLFIPYYIEKTEQISNKIIIFFHGTGNDLSQDHNYLSQIRNGLKASILGVEYPGYGIYMNKGKPTPENIQEDSLIVYDYVRHCLLYPEEDIIVMGLSMGSGPASYLSSQRKFSLLVLLMPYHSWRRLAQDKASFIGKLVPKDYFHNFNNIKQGIHNCKILLIHGEKDELIPVQESKDMEKYMGQFENFKSVYPHNMKHCWHDVNYHCIFPIKDYLYEQNMMPHEISEEHSKYKLQLIQEIWYKK